MFQKLFFLGSLIIFANYEAQTLTAIDCSPLAGDHFQKRFEVGSVIHKDGQNVIWNYYQKNFYYKDTVRDTMVATSSASSLSLTNTYVYRKAQYPVGSDVYRANNDSLIRMADYGNEILALY